MTSREPTEDLDYLRKVERLAQVVVGEAAAEAWLTFGPDGQKAADPLHRAINELATSLRFVHFDGDGCTDHADA